MSILYRWLALIAAMAVSALFGAMEMHARDARAYDLLLANIKAEGRKALEHTATVVAKQRALNHETISLYNARLAALRRHFANRVPTVSCSYIMPAVSDTAAGTNEAPADNVSDSGDIPSIDALPLHCAETTLQLIMLQSWVDNQGAIK